MMNGLYDASLRQQERDLIRRKLQALLKDHSNDHGRLVREIQKLIREME